MANELKCLVVTPEKAVLSKVVDFVAIPMYDGELGVLPGRAPLIGKIGFGELRTQKGNEINRFYIDGGFLQIRDNVVTILTQTALPEEKLAVEEAKQNLDETLQPAKSPELIDEQIEKQMRARVKLRLARKKQVIPD